MLLKEEESYAAREDEMIIKLAVIANKVSDTEQNGWNGGQKNKQENFD